VKEIITVPGRVEGDVVETADLFHTRHGQLVRAEGWPPHPDRFARAGYDLARLMARPVLDDEPARGADSIDAHLAAAALAAGPLATSGLGVPRIDGAD
jgi:hypothetical protein